MSTPIAVVTAIAAALVFGVSSVADQRSTKRVQTRRALSPRIFVDLVREPLWVLAVGANAVGFVLQIVALSFGSLAVVQPLLVCDLIFAVLLAGYLRRREGTWPGRRATQVVFAGVCATTAGVAGFLAIGQPSGGTTHARLSILPPLATGLVVVVGGCLVLAARNQNLRPLALALACGICYGVSAFLVKLVTSETGHGLPGLFSNWPIYLLVVVGPAGFLLNQDAFQQGKFLAPVQAIITAADPIISIGLAVLWLTVRLRGGPAAISGEVVSLLLMTTGIVFTAHLAPSSQARTKPAVAQRGEAGNPQGAA